MPTPHFTCPRCGGPLVVTNDETVVNCPRCTYHAAHVAGEGMVEGACCVICIDGVEGLRRADDKKIECGRCRDEHPRAGRITFDSDKALGRVSTGAAHAYGWKRRKGGS